MRLCLSNLPSSSSWGIGILRTSIVYALGYLAATGSARLERIRNAMQTPLYTRATAMINRWGAYAVPLCFLTVGLQTAVIITTGFTKMPMRRWLPGMLLGTLIWAIIYVTIGFALLAAFGFEPWMVPLIFRHAYSDQRDSLKDSHLYR